MNNNFRPILTGIGLYCILVIFFLAAQVGYLHFAVKSVNSVQAYSALISKSNPVMIFFVAWSLANFLIAGYVAAKLEEGNKLLSAVLTGVGSGLIVVLVTIALMFISLNTNPKLTQAARDKYNTAIATAVTTLPTKVIRAAFYTLIGGGIYVIKSRKNTAEPASKPKKKSKKK